MTETSKKILESFQIRKSKGQKAEFRRWFSEELRKAGHAPREEHHGGLIPGCNLVVGDPDTAEVICTAHYDTCAAMPVPNFITPRSMFWYLLYQLALVAVIFLFAAAVEYLQWLTQTGVADIDDSILNFAGAAAAYVVTRSIQLIIGMIKRR